MVSFAKNVIVRWSIPVRVMVQRMEVDRAVFFLLLSRGSQLLAYPVTIFFLAMSLSPEVQGFYFTSYSLLALQVFAELGFGIVITNVASHEWSQLGLDGRGRIIGQAEASSRLMSLARLVVKWYAAASFVFVGGVGLVGWLFFSAYRTSVGWQLPWIGLVVLSGMLLWMLPLNALLEGCNQVAAVNRFRFSQVLVENVTLWIVLMLGGGLWAPVAAAATRVLRNAYFLGIEYKEFFRPVFGSSPGARINWRREIWPMQWRLGVAGLVTYFFSSLLTPVMFYYQGPIAAGQMGMTWQMAIGLQLIATAWVSTNVPRFGMYIALKDYAGLDHLWWRISKVSIVAITAGAVTLWVTIYVMGQLHMSLADRLLDPLSAGLLLLTIIAMQVGYCLVAYLRAHKQEPILAANVTMGLVSGFLVWFFGSQYGPRGAAAGLLAQALVGTSWIAAIWRQRRTTWHESSSDQ